jgi:hypothetical protein
MKKLLLLGVLFIGLAGVVKIRDDERAPSRPELLASGQIASISRGERVELDDHLDADVWTVIEFGALW